MKSNLANRKLKSLKETIFLITSSFIFIFPAFLNGFPLFTSDSGTYMHSGFGPSIPIDRPVLYGIFIRHFSLKESMWFPIFVQGLIASWLLSQIIKHFIPKYFDRLSRLMIFILMAALTSLPWFCSQIMADVFSPFAILCIALLLLAPNQNRIEKIFTILLMVFSAMTHNSHLLVITLLIATIGLPVIFRKYFGNTLITIKRWASVFLIVISCWFFSAFVNYLIDGKYRLTGSPHVFLMARFAESGILEDYLNYNCNCQEPQKINDSQKYTIISKRSKKVFDIDGINNSDGARLQQWLFVDGPNQKFNIVHVKDDRYKFIAFHSGKALTVSNDPLKQIIQEADSNKSSQLFQLVETKDHFYSIKQPGSDEAFEIKDAAGNNGATIQLNKYSATDNQKFSLLSDSSWKLCFYQGQIPASAIGFIWAENSILWRTGGWIDGEKEYKTILKAILLSPKYFFWNLRECITSTFRQLVHFDVGDGIYRYGENSPPWGVINSHFKKDFNTFVTSLQNTSGINFVETNKRIFVTVIIGSLLIILFLGRKVKSSSNEVLRMFCFICILSVLFNAFVSGALANVLDRLQSRIVWLIPFCAIIVSMEFVELLINKAKGKSN